MCCKRIEINSKFNLFFGRYRPLVLHHIIQDDDTVYRFAGAEGSIGRSDKF